MAENPNKEDIFDWVMKFEDECLEKVREKVILTAEYNFGDNGRKVAEKYYRQIDGEEDYENDEVDENCDDCKERAKKLLRNLEIVHHISENLLKDSLEQVTKDININKLLSILDDITKEILDKTCFDLNPTDLKVRILLEACRRLIPDDKATQ